MMQAGDLINIYYNLPKGCLFDLGSLISVIPFSYKSLLEPDIGSISNGIYVESLMELLKNRDGVISIKDKFLRFLKPKKYWPLFFPEFLKKEGSQFVYRDIVKSNKIGRRPPSTEIYHLATDELWSIQMNYSSAFRTDGLIPLINAIRENKNLEANICIAHPEKLFNISKTDVDALYGEECEQILPEILNNSYPIKDIQKFLYPPEVDYIRKLNDTFAALYILDYHLREEGFENKVQFWTYNKANPTLRATFVSGNNNILDFIYFPENWIGMTGTLCRFDLKDNKSLYGDLFEMAIKERENLKLEEIELRVLMDLIKEKLAERVLLQDWYIEIPYANTGCIEEVKRSFEYLDRYLRNECRNNERRNKFLNKIGKLYDISKNNTSINILPQLNP